MSRAACATSSANSTTPRPSRHRRPRRRALQPKLHRASRRRHVRRRCQASTRSDLPHDAAVVRTGCTAAQRPCQHPMSETTDTQESFLSHLIELRMRLMRSIIAVVVVLAVLFPFAKDIYGLLAQPLLRVLPQGATMIATDVTGTF